MKQKKKAVEYKGGKCVWFVAIRGVLRRWIFITKTQLRKRRIWHRSIEEPLVKFIVAGERIIMSKIEPKQGT